MPKFEKEARQAYEAAFQRKVIRVGHPAGRRKKSIRLYIDDGTTVIATKRRTPGHAVVEANVLKALHARNAPVPEVIAFDGEILFQEDLGKTRLSKALTSASPAECERLLDGALTSLAKTHDAAKAANLKENVLTLDGEAWRTNLLAVPKKLGNFLDLPAPTLSMEAFDRRLHVAAPEFVKWDARPPNAVIHKDGIVRWVDWEHCGRRNRLDDLVWLFGDQSCPDFPDVEQRLLDKHLPAFIDNMDPDDARDYFAAYGTLHMCVRLGLTLNSQSKRGLKSWSSVLQDNPELPSNAHRLATKASRWAALSTVSSDLAPWLRDIAHQIEAARYEHADRKQSLFGKDWENWVQTNIDAGIDRDVIFQTLLDARFDYHLLKEKLGFAPALPGSKTIAATNSHPIAKDTPLDGSRPIVMNRRRSKRKTLTIGMATYDDYNGVYFTLQSLRLHHPEVQDRIEYLVMDNNPGSNDGKASKMIADLTGKDGDFPRCRYLPYETVKGTSAARNELFLQAETDFVMCVDCHVIFAPGAIQRFINYIDERPNSSDLLQGVILADDLKTISTHFAPTFEDGKERWVKGMLGEWATDDRGRDPDADPFEIPMQGLGVFAMRKDAWPGFNRHFRGFGGEEGYIHEKVRQMGGKTLCLPFLRWLHRFSRPQGVPYPLTWEDRIHNYVIGHRENGLDEAEIKEHFSAFVGKGVVDKVLGELAGFDPLG